MEIQLTIYASGGVIVRSYWRRNRRSPAQHAADSRRGQHFGDAFSPLRPEHRAGPPREERV